MKNIMKKIGCVIFFGLLILLAANACDHGDGAAQDSDNDGLSDTDEVQVYGTDPYKWDTDGDGRGDGEEVLAGTNPLAADYARALTLNNTSSDDVTVYIVFIGELTGNGGSYTAKYFQDQGCTMYGRDRCSITIPKKVGTKTLNLNKGGINLSGGLGHEPMGPCPTTMFEINMSPRDNPTTDHYDLSLVNGFNYAMQIKSSKGPATAHVTKAAGNQNAYGVFPLGCSVCVATGSRPPDFTGCPGNASSCGGQCFNPNECKSGPDEFHANVRCDVANVPTGGTYTVDFSDPSH